MCAYKTRALNNQTLRSWLHLSGVSCWSLCTVRACCSTQANFIFAQLVGAFEIIIAEILCSYKNSGVIENFSRRKFPAIRYIIPLSSHSLMIHHIYSAKLQNSRMVYFLHWFLLGYHALDLPRFALQCPAFVYLLLLFVKDTLYAAFNIPL